MLIDAHVHYLRRRGFLDELLREMDGAGVERCHLVGLCAMGFMNSVTGGNAEVLEAARAHPDRIAAFGYVDPREAESAEEVKRLAGEGAQGFKLFPPVGYRVDEARFSGTFEAITATGLPVLVHCGQTNLDYAKDPHTRAINSALARPMCVDPLTRLYPRTTFVIAHMGFPYLMEAWSLALANANVVLDTAGARTWPWCWVEVYNGLGRPIPIDWKRVWWGTDNCMKEGEGLSYARERLAEAGCTEEEVGWVLGGCAEKVVWGRGAKGVDGAGRGHMIYIVKGRMDIAGEGRPMRAHYVVITILFPGLGHILKGEHLKGVVISICWSLPLQGFLYSTFVWTDLFHPGFSTVSLALLAGIWILAIVDISRRLYFVDENATAREKDRLFRESSEAYLKGDLNRAEEALGAMLKLDREDADGHFHLAMILKAKGETEKARRALRRCRSVDDSDKWGWEIEKEQSLLGTS